MHQNLRLARFTTRDLLIAIALCSLGLALVAWVASMHRGQHGRISILQTAAMVVGCSLVSRGVCYPFHVARRSVVAIVTITVTCVLVLLMLRPR